MPDSRSVKQTPLTEGQQRILDELHKCKPMTWPSQALERSTSAVVSRGPDSERGTVGH